VALSFATRTLLAADIAAYGWSVGEHSYGAPLVHEKWIAGLTIGRFVSISGGVEIMLGDHRIDTVSTYPFLTLQDEWPGSGSLEPDHDTRGPVWIGSDVWLGPRAIILSGVSIGHGAVVVAGAVVDRDVPAYAVVAGNPAQVVRFRFEPAIVERLLAIAWWDWPDTRIGPALPLIGAARLPEFLAIAEAVPALPAPAIAEPAIDKPAADAAAPRVAPAALRPADGNGPTDPRPGFTELVPPRSYARVAASLFNVSSADSPDLVRNLYQTLSGAQAAVPAEGFIFLPECYVIGGEKLLDADMEWVQESMIDSAPTSQLTAETRARIVGGHVSALRHAEPLIHICKRGCDNYGHFLSDVAPKLMHLQRAGFRAVGIVMPDHAMRFWGLVELVCGHLGIQATRLETQAGRIERARNLFFFTRVAKHNTLKSPTLLELRDLLLSACDASPGPARKLLICRDPGERRFLTNQAALCAALGERGFECVYPGRMTFPEQVRLFAQASCVVGSTGAGLTNIVFAPPGTPVFCVSNFHPDYYFWDLACLGGQPFAWFFTEPIQRWEWEKSTRPFTVDVPAVLQALDLLGW
jgi:acetyltransferase-like isoleucine patch superfamily enzyme